MPLAPPEARIVTDGIWLIHLRWLAVIGIVVFTYIASQQLGISVVSTPIYYTSIALFTLNFVYYYSFRKILLYEHPSKYRLAERIVHFQIVTDLILLTVLLHFTGGVENPLVLFYMFHMIIASILLSRIMSFLHSTFAIALLAALAILEYYEILPHHSLTGFTGHEYFQSFRYLVGTCFVFITTSYLVVYFTSSISKELIEQEEAYFLANIELNKKDTIKNEYVLRLTHDIKGHLAAIQNLLDVVLHSDDPTEIKDFAQRAHARVERLTHFSVELLRLTRIRLTDRFEKHEIQIHEFINRVVETNQEMAHLKGIHLSSPHPRKPLIIHANRLSMEEVLNNLIQNALRYTQQGGTVKVSLSSSEKEVAITISDSGIGIPPEELQHVFNELYRASNARALTSEGSGIGLTLVKQIVERHGGSVSIESEEGKGTKVKVKLPRG